MPHSLGDGWLTEIPNSLDIVKEQSIAFDCTNYVFPNSDTHSFIMAVGLSSSSPFFFGFSVFEFIVSVLSSGERYLKSLSRIFLIDHEVDVTGDWLACLEISAV